MSEGDEAIKKYRDPMGVTNKDNAAEGTIRKKTPWLSKRTPATGSDGPGHGGRGDRLFL